MRTIGDVKGKKATNKVAVVVLTALLVGIYYSQLTGIEFIGVSFLYRYLWAAAVVLISLCAFLVTTDLNKMARLAKLTLLLCLPHLWTIFISFPIWVARLDTFEIMRRGFFNEDDIFHERKIELRARDLEIFLCAQGLNAVVGGTVDGKFADGIALFPEFLFHMFSVSFARIYLVVNIIIPRA